MASNPSSNSVDPHSAGWLATLSAWVHRNLLWLLVASYVLAAIAPTPGLAIRGWSPKGAPSEEVNAPHLLLAMLLFCAAAVVRWGQLRELMQRPGILLWGLLAIWLVPVAFVSGLGWALPQILSDQASSGMLVGLALIAAMPTANSSVAWCQNAKGNVALSLGLIVLTIVLCPLLTPQLLNLMGFSLSGQDTAQIEELMKRFSGTSFIVWVIFPSIAGMAFNHFAGPEWIDRLRTPLRMVSAITLLTLNYSSASIAMPNVLAENATRTLATSAILAMLLSMLGIASGWLVARLLTADRPATTSMMFGSSMKHTGLALVIADHISQEEPRVILMIILATLLQHIVAGMADWWFMHRAEPKT